ncbi:copper-binding protein [Sphingomonas parva]|uniref:Copper-binding protein n=1 Tax=Sphingomonas parva TaxID=2555898 RepID=A0A4Y8ZV09_9SPHN|nr:copper-binding protein [Sphingomonas parva]
MLAACNNSNQDTPEANAQGAPAATSATADQTFAGSGTVTRVEGKDVTISHGAVEAAGWPAMTMTFTAERPELATSVKAGDRVSFEFRKSGGGATLTSISKP